MATDEELEEIRGRLEAIEASLELAPRLEAIQVKRDDTVVIRYPGRLAPTAAVNIARQVSTHFPTRLGIRVMVFDEGGEVHVLRPDEA